jgi:protein-disulfide isomerase-like protein with CxxC motif
MPDAYVITENKTAMLLVEQLLPAHLATIIRVINGDGRYGAATLAASMGLSKHKPVALIVDTQLESDETLEEKRTFLKSLLGHSPAPTFIGITDPDVNVLQNAQHPLAQELIQFLEQAVLKLPQ